MPASIPTPAPGSDVADGRTPSASPAAAGSTAGSAPVQAGGSAATPLRVCSLPSCGLVEPVALHFRLCARCGAVAYCTAAHGGEHWRAGHRRDCAALKAAGAAPPTAVASAGAGAASVEGDGAAAGAAAAASASSQADVATLRGLVEKWAEKYGSDSLVGARLRVDEAAALRNGAVRELGAARVALCKASWAALLAAVGALAQRMAAVRLQPGGVREEKRAFYVRTQLALAAAEGVPPALGAAALRAASACVGYDAAAQFALVALRLLLLLPPALLPEPERRRVEAFVLAALGAVADTGGLDVQPKAELHLVGLFERDLGAGFGRSHLDPAFHAALLRVWASPAVAAVLRTRGTLQRGAAANERIAAEDEVRRRADVAARGFRACALPAYGRRETTVRHFKLCTGCTAVAYCCEEHSAVHWAEGHRRNCTALRAAGAKPPSTADA